MNTRTISIATAAGLSLFAACAPAVTVDRSDASAPSVSISLATAADLQARFDDNGEPLTAAVDPARPFTVAVRHDLHRIGLLFDAEDEQSGIRMVEAEIQVGFICRTSFLGNPVGMRRGTTFYERFPASIPSGDAPRTRRIVGEGFTLEDLWRGGRCDDFGDFREAWSGSIQDISATYIVRAWNNAGPPPLRTEEIRGTFKVEGDPDVSVESERR